ncbi:MAG: VWA domain-containing protein [Candidatus Omnitrophica bacterium]|nr:VWA domain-containing protein [Candidatus Omnitrophota bacterium]MBU4479708.1 VWA domain-containing protein [Candidatus Omnitrophota bacterium]MCG2703502.1 VWA domain-containing protein [Candidatus Omnitrophota bacterium]
MVFKDPWVLLLLVFVPLLLLRKRTAAASVRFSSRSLIAGLAPSWKLFARNKLVALRMLSAALFIVALARPQAPVTHQRIYKEGVDIVLALDVSTSMRALDFTLGNKRCDRLSVVKKVVEEFIKERNNDRIGMIAFAGRPYVACPLTLDHDWLMRNLERVEIAMVEDGTAIGSSIAAGLNRLRQSKAKTKIIILLTDGRNNAGKISPLTAAEAAKALGVKIYTIGAGSIGEVPYPVQNAFGQTSYQYVKIDMDESLLARIADMTNGKYFHATDTASLKTIYEQINKLEKTLFQQPEYRNYQERFVVFVLWAIAFLFLEQVLSSTLLRAVP